MVKSDKQLAKPAKMVPLESPVFTEAEADELSCHGTPAHCAEHGRASLALTDEQECHVSHVHGSGLVQQSNGCMPNRMIDEHEWIDFGHSLQLVLFSRQWALAESLVALADHQLMLDYGLSVALDAIWFLRTEQDLKGLNHLIAKIVESGAKDFARAILRTSLLASCVVACQSKTLTLGDSKEIIAQSLHERLQDCPGSDRLQIEAGAKVQKFIEWVLQCIHLNRCSEETECYKGNCSTHQEIFTEAFDAACFPLTLFSTLFEPGWSSGSSAVAIQGLLSLLVEGGADNVNQCFLEAARFGSTELVHILLKIAHQNSLAVDVDLALVYASHYCKFETMECLVDEGNATSFLCPLVKASEHGCLQVVQWFVNRGVSDIEMCLAVTTAASSGHFVVASYLLAHIPRHVLEALSIQILKAARGQGSGSFEGVAFLLRSNFLNDAAATYAVADSIATMRPMDVPQDLVDFLKEQWSQAAFVEGVGAGEEHFVNITRVLRRGTSPIHLPDLPEPMVLAIAYLPLYRACTSARGQLLPQRLRGELVEAIGRLRKSADTESHGNDLLPVLEHHLPSFVIGA
ncbi:hypothetical protein GUJ93_ZPchr0006g45535 [Zizania palustris]|uniref:Ankyrin repeat protein SKIP35 n=1 Tax=Zizania palustris TaxID=103762 RepID=A0A8J5STG9_ZIZPA|nr:hypothetical protein GUJ93_ZPchr0006g45535 [Zizania palustris]